MPSNAVSARRPGAGPTSVAIHVALEGMLEDLFGFAMTRTRSRDEAADLVQAVAVEVLRCGGSVRSSGALTAWIWAVARRVYARWVRVRSRERGMCISDGLQVSLLTAPETDPTRGLILAEATGALTREIALLSASYREVIVAHYLRGQSYDDIAATLGLPLSTVKWRLHEARGILREGLSTMRKFGQLSSNPARVSFSSHGNWNPAGQLTSLLRQNILLAAYEKPMSPSELAAELGVASAFVEDEVAGMVQRETLERVRGDRARTTFIVHTADAHRAAAPILAQLSAQITPLLAAAPELIHANLAAHCDLPVHRQRLLPLVVPDAIYACYDELAQGIISYDKMPKHGDGRVGWAIAWEVAVGSSSLLSRSNMRLVGTPHGSVYQAVYWAEGRGWEKILGSDDVELVCRVALDGNDGTMPVPSAGSDPALEESLARLIASGHLVLEGPSVGSRLVVLTEGEKGAYDRAAEPVIAPVRKAIGTAYAAVVNALTPLVPAHLRSQTPVVALSLVSDMPPELPGSVWSPDAEWPCVMAMVVEKRRP